MAKEDVCDVRIVTYDTCKGKVGNISFHDKLSDLIGDEGCRVSLVRLPKYPNRLYFRAWSKNATKKRAVKLASGKLQYAQKDSVDILADFVGEYQLQYDDVASSSGSGMYYVNREKATQPGYRGGNSKVPHPNYTNGKRITIPKVNNVDITIPISKAHPINIPHTYNNPNVVKNSDLDIRKALELLDVLDFVICSNDDSSAVYKNGHTLIETIKGILR